MGLFTVLPFLLCFCGVMETRGMGLFTVVLLFLLCFSVFLRAFLSASCESAIYVGGFSLEKPRMRCTYVGHCERCEQSTFPCGTRHVHGVAYICAGVLCTVLFNVCSCII